MTLENDQTMTREIQDDLVESERLRRLYETVLSNTPDLVYIFGLDHRFVYANAALLEMWGRTWEESIGKNCLELGYEPWHAEMHDREIEQVIATKAPIRGVVPFDGQKGRRLYDYIFSPVIGPDGNVEAIAGTTRDVTDSVAAQGDLESSEAQYRQIAEGLPQMVWSADPQGKRDYFNERWLQITGVGADQAENPWTTVMHPDDVSRAQAGWELAVKSGATFQAEYRLRSREGRYHWFLGRALPIRDEKEKIVRWFGTCTDIDEQKATQNLLQITNDFAAVIAADLDVGRIIKTLTDATTNVIGAEFGSFFYNVVNEDGEAFLLYTLSGAPIEAFEKFGLPRATPIFAPTFRGEAIVRSDDITKDARYGKMGPHHGMPKGHLPVVSYLAVPVTSRSGEVIGGLFYGHSTPAMFTQAHEQIVSSFAAQATLAMDNARLYERLQTMNEELEQRVQERTKELLGAVERLNGFTYHVSHDLRTPLRTIAATSRIIQEDFGTSVPPQVHLLLNRQVEGATKLGMLVDDLLQYSRLARQGINCQQIDVTTLAREVFDEAKTTHPYSTAQLQVAEGMKLDADPGLMRLALYNIVENAVKYSPQGGTIRIGQREDGALFVSDEGIGIETQYLAKIFEPFQRLHRDEEFKGTGIGLANVKQVVERHGGSVWVESELGKGSVFYIALR